MLLLCDDFMSCLQKAVNGRLISENEGFLRKFWEFAPLAHSCFFVEVYNSQCLAWPSDKGTLKSLGVGGGCAVVLVCFLAYILFQQQGKQVREAGVGLFSGRSVPWPRGSAATGMVSVLLCQGFLQNRPPVV